MKIKFIRKEKLSESIISFYFTKPSNFKYLAGQYTEIKFPGETYESIGGNRWFTLSSSPTETELVITTKISENNSKFKTELLSMNQGDEITISEPIGDYVLPKSPNVPLVFIAGGIGITPTRSIIKYLFDTDEQRNIKLTYITKSKDDVLFSDIFNEYKLDLINIYTEETRNRSDYGVELKYNPESFFYVSGPQGMVETIANELSKLYGSQQVIMDYFPGYKSI